MTAARPYLFDILRDLRQPLAALAGLLIIVNLATATAFAHPEKSWAALCIGSTTTTPDGDTAPVAPCPQCCLSAQGQPGPNDPTIETPTDDGVRFITPGTARPVPPYDPAIFGPRGPPVPH